MPFWDSLLEGLLEGLDMSGYVWILVSKIEEEFNSDLPGPKKSFVVLNCCQDRYYTGWEAWLPELWKVMGLPQMPLSQAGWEDPAEKTIGF